MARLTKAAARRRLQEAQRKFLKVYTSSQYQIGSAVKTSDMEAIVKIVDRCVKRLK